MKIPNLDAHQYWLQIAQHTNARTSPGNNTGAPWPLQVQVAALVGNENIEASTTNFSGAAAPSTWAVAVITADARLIRVRMEFDAEQYDLERDRETQNPVVTTVSESWVRRLGDVVSLDIGGMRMRPNSFGRTMPDVLDVGDVSLTFRDGAVADLGVDQVEMAPHDDRGRSDGFMDALRKHTGL